VAFVIIAQGNPLKGQYHTQNSFELAHPYQYETKRGLLHLLLDCGAVGSTFDVFEVLGHSCIGGAVVGRRTRDRKVDI